jgi:uncharacterized membrane protein
MLVLMGFALFENRKTFSITIMQKCIGLAVAAAEVLLIYTFLYVFWDPAGSALITMQGRYLIPLTPMAFMLFHNTRLRMPLSRPIYLAGTAAVISLSVSLVVIMHRFYG